MLNKIVFLSVLSLGLVALIGVSLSAAQNDRRAADREAIRAHIEGIFHAYINKDREKVRATHSEDWRGFLTDSRVISRGIDEYMQAADRYLKSEAARMVSFKLTDFDVIFHGDTAIVNYVADTEIQIGNSRFPDKLRTLDVYAKRNGHWIQVASNTARHPDALAAERQQPVPIMPALRREILDAREAVWRAWFASDQASLEKVIPIETIAINAGEEPWGDRAAVLTSSKQFAESGGKLLRLEFPRTEIQLYGDIAILYTTYLFEIDVNGQRETSTGRGTEIFGRRGNTWVNSGWHLDSGK